MTAKGYFITGTDTSVGKTHVALALMSAFKAQGKQVTGMKPVSAGGRETKDGLRNDDAELLMRAASVALPYELINPYAFKPAVAPHIAAQLAGINIDIQHIKHCYRQIASNADIVIVEGAGGWLVPVNDHQTMADAAASLNLPVILVVGMRLGCLNHALLSVESIRSKGMVLTGWVANHISPTMEKSKNNIECLKQLIPSPLLGIIPHNSSVTSRQAAMDLDISLLMKTE
ncbi:MAG: dethiobiotin synthase [Gammaproteobacteria bacterium]|nr:dethiobiotin synthase [Gammaproteobacteria bacterium]